jgi:hypothetical protein
MMLERRQARAVPALRSDARARGTRRGIERVSVVAVVGESRRAKRNRETSGDLMIGGGETVCPDRSGEALTDLPPLIASVPRQEEYEAALRERQHHVIAAKQRYQQSPDLRRHPVGHPIPDLLRERVELVELANHERGMPHGRSPVQQRPGYVVKGFA